MALLHAEVYRRRGDAGAVLSACPPWGAALAGLGRPMPPVFDEQVRHLGPSVLPLAGPASLDSCRNAYFLPDGCLCIGTTRDRAVFNAELLEKCSQAYLLAFLARGLELFDRASRAVAMPGIEAANDVESHNEHYYHDGR